MVIDGSNGGVTLNAIGVANGYLDSAVASVFYGLLSPIKTVVTTFAGGPAAGFGHWAVWQLALFSNPQGVGIDRAGNVYARLDTGNSVIRRISPAGLGTPCRHGHPGIATGTGNQCAICRAERCVC